MRNWSSLKSDRNFDLVFKRGRFTKTENFILYHIPENSVDHVRIGICVGKSLGKAVIRNRLKRQIREALNELEPRENSSDIVIIARKRLLGNSFDTIRRAVRAVFSKARLI